MDLRGVNFSKLLVEFREFTFLISTILLEFSESLGLLLDAPRSIVDFSDDLIDLFFDVSDFTAEFSRHVVEMLASSCLVAFLSVRQVLGSDQLTDELVATVEGFSIVRCFSRESFTEIIECIKELLGGGHALVKRVNEDV